MRDEKVTQSFGDIVISPAAPEIVVVLVEAKDARNIGAVARAMGNLSVSDLRLVTPAPFDREMAKSVACWSEGIIEGVKEFEALSDAVGDAHEVVGFASDSSEHRMSPLILEDWVETVMSEGPKKIALVFGSEDQGLRRDHFPLCQNLIRIPSATENPSYNLAQSVILALYALRRTRGGAIGDEKRDLPNSQHMAHYASMVVRTAEQVGFLNENSPAHIEELITNLCRRGRFSTRELKIMTGLFGMIHKRLG